MRLAVVGWAADSGVGRELIDAMRHLPVSSSFILPNKIKPTRVDLITKTPCHFSTGHNPRVEMETFINRYKPDTILTWEVPGSWDFPDIWSAHGIRWVHVVHWDWFAPNYSGLWKKAVLVAPNKLCQDELANVHGLKSTLLSVPVDTDRLVFQRRKICQLFVSMYGYGGLENRRSLPEVFGAWGAMRAPPPLVIRAQHRPYEIDSSPLPAGVSLDIRNVPEPSDLWNTGDVAVQPSRYEGLGLGLLEAQARGVPVITTDAPPMNEIAPDLLVPCIRKEMVMHLGRSFPSYVPSPEHIRARVEELHMKDVSELSDRARRRSETMYSWKALRQRWIEILQGHP